MPYLFREDQQNKRNNKKKKQKTEHKTCGVIKEVSTIFMNYSQLFSIKGKA